MLHEIPYSELTFNPMTAFAKDWMALAAGNETDGCNAMTVSWGHVGALWDSSLPTAVCYVRPQRYTKQFIDREDLFTLSCFGNEQRSALTILGQKSGRDGDKIKEAGLTPVFENGTVHFAEARLVLVCRKLYHAPILEEGFVDPAMAARNYPAKDFHEMYIGQIIKVLKDD